MGDTSCLDGTHYDSQGNILTKNTNNKLSYTKISYNILSNINKQSTIPCKIMQTQRYTFGHLSLIQNLALDIPSGVATVRDLESASQKREIFGVL